MKQSKKMKRGDFLMLLFTGTVAGGLFLWTGSSNWISRLTREEGDPLKAKVKREGEIIAEIDLNSITDTEYIYFEEGIKVTIEVKPGKIRFLSSGCTDKICVNTGWLTREGHIAACMPSRIVVSVT
ncbi:NusG domain II-containing protein [Bacillaceae bacterium IKA-2]|nr:NusG domain II-containing protein [Bacillaceae bacterium IKA-2]